jgi:hypothetical protein
VHMDIVSPLPTSAEWFSYLFIMVDRSTRLLKEVPIKSFFGSDVCGHLHRHVGGQYGVPAIITSDQGCQAALQARLARKECPDHLPSSMLRGLKSAPKEQSAAISSAKLMFGTTLSLPAEFVQGGEPPA